MHFLWLFRILLIDLQESLYGFWGPRIVQLAVQPNLKSFFFKERRYPAALTNPRISEVVGSVR